ncbi:hypothetical protein GYMLUDRAFT_261263 [Collybiopsis luxurians FD-317 M1]|uniref:Uncharacterized protein n=1 Tax=Collybiopsis luxurians FD-317 M1 TaxID=944289 RepID=A0A0D0CPV7_9AGAR|nr:hypothetical protein GYMLUDRAFT_261263 [Collybiopsis luxurians FD-317 M1]
MPKDYTEREKVHLSSTRQRTYAPYVPEDSSHSSLRHGLLSPESPWERGDTALAIALRQASVPLRAARYLQSEVSRNKRRRIVEDEDSDAYEEDGRSLNDRNDDSDEDEYVTMKVTRRERQEILQRREERAPRQSDDFFDERSYKRSERDEARRYRDQRRERAANSGVSMLSNARGVTINGGSMSVVGRDQTIIETIDEGNPRQPEARATRFQSPIMSDRNERKAKGFPKLNGTGRTGLRDDSPECLTSPMGTEISACVTEDVRISGGRTSAVHRNQTTRITRPMLNRWGTGNLPTPPSEGYYY